MHAAKESGEVEASATVSFTSVENVDLVQVECKLLQGQLGDKDPLRSDTKKSDGRDAAQLLVHSLSCERRLLFHLEESKQRTNRLAPCSVALFAYAHRKTGIRSRLAE